MNHPSVDTQRPNVLVSVLNAFRHLRMNHRNGRAGIYVQRQCSTPFGIYEGITGDVSLGRIRQVECSTPFGIYEGITLGPDGEFFGSSMCSTPFGIYEGITPLRQRWIAARMRAQRLSASTNESPLKVYPFVQLEQVLNAFRHLRMNHMGLDVAVGLLAACSTPFGIYEGITRMARSRGPARGSAQRLSASTNESPPTSGLPPSKLAGVLNAFRHLRMNHCWSETKNARRRTCSTPFGIYEGITPVRAEPMIVKDRAQRLSASTNESLRRAATTRCGKMCSTPFGIYEGITGEMFDFHRRRSSAQRLSASTNESPQIQV